MVNYANFVNLQVPWPNSSDLATIRTTFKLVLDAIAPNFPPFVEIDNEEWTLSYHSGSVEDLIAFVEAMIDVGHSYDPPIKVTNAGLTARGLLYLVYDSQRHNQSDCLESECSFRNDEGEIVFPLDYFPVFLPPHRTTMWSEKSTCSLPLRIC